MTFFKSKWSYRRFTYDNLVTTFSSSNTQHSQRLQYNFPAIHNEYQSEETTGGVYKRQGRIQYIMIQSTYKGFLVQVRQLQ